MIYVNFCVGQNGRIDDVPEGMQQNAIFREKTIYATTIRTQSDGERNDENRITFLVPLADRKSSVTNSILPLTLAPRVPPFASIYFIAASDFYSTLPVRGASSLY